MDTGGRPRRIAPSPLALPPPWLPAPPGGGGRPAARRALEDWPAGRPAVSASSRACLPLGLPVGPADVRGGDRPCLAQWPASAAEAAEAAAAAAAEAVGIQASGALHA